MNDTRETIKQVALEMFANDGYEKTTLTRIAEKVGIKKASIYFHFPSKEDLFNELIDEIIKKYYSFLDSLVEQSEGLEIGERLHKIFKNIIGFYENNRKTCSFYFRFKLLGRERYIEKDMQRSIRVKETYLGVIGKLTQIFSTGISDKSIRDVEAINAAESFYWLCNMCAIKMFFYDKVYTKVDIEREWRLYFEGIKN